MTVYQARVSIAPRDEFDGQRPDLGAHSGAVTGTCTSASSGVSALPEILLSGVSSALGQAKPLPFEVSIYNSGSCATADRIGTFHIDSNLALLGSSGARVIYYDASANTFTSLTSTSGAMYATNGTSARRYVFKP